MVGLMTWEYDAAADEVAERVLTGARLYWWSKTLVIPWFAV